MLLGAAHQEDCLQKNGTTSRVVWATRTLLEALNRARWSGRSAAAEARARAQLGARREREVRDEELTAVLRVITAARRYYEQAGVSGDEVMKARVAAVLALEESLECKFHRVAPLEQPAILDPQTGDRRPHARHGRADWPGGLRGEPAVAIACAATTYVRHAPRSWSVDRLSREPGESRTRGHSNARHRE